MAASPHPINAAMRNPNRRAAASVQPVAGANAYWVPQIRIRGSRHAGVAQLWSLGVCGIPK